MQRAVLYFTAPGKVSIRSAKLPAPGTGQLLVQVTHSAISSGTEMLFYRGEIPAGLALDEQIEVLAGKFEYPFQYGYAAVGQVIAQGGAVTGDWLGRQVFGFQPHQSHFLSTVDQVIPLPEGLSAEAALFLPNMESAVSFVMDSRPVIGERVAVFGQGILGLLTTALLSRFPLGDLISFDRYELRRKTSLELGAQQSLDPAMIAPQVDGAGLQPFDLVYELSGNPAALDQAIAVTGFAGRVLIGSWYGSKRAAIDLGSSFHRNQIRLIGSQVSRIAPQWTGRWSKARRLETAWRMIERVDPAQLITDRFPFDQAAAAFERVDRRPQETMQVILEYAI